MSTSSDDSEYLVADTENWTRAEEYCCWCGYEILMVPRRSRDNPTHRYFRCGKAAYNMYLPQREDHVFLWVDEAYGPENEAEDAVDKKAGGGHGCCCGGTIELLTCRSGENRNRRYFRCEAVEPLERCLNLWVDEAYLLEAYLDPNVDFWDDSYISPNLWPDQEPISGGQGLLEEAHEREEESVEEAHEREEESLEEEYEAQEVSDEEDFYL